MRGLFQIAVLLPIAFTVALPTGPGYKARQLDANTQLDHLDGQISRRSPVTTRKQAAANNAANTGNTGNTGTGSGSTPPPAGNNVPIPQRNSEVSQGDKQNNPLGLTGPGGQGGPRQMAGGVVGYDPNSKAPTAALDGRKDASGLDAAQMAGVNDKLGGPLTTTGHGTQADKDALAKNLSKQPSANQQGSANTVPLANAEAPPRVFGSNSNEPERTFGTIPLQNSNRRTPKFQFLDPRTQLTIQYRFRWPRALGRRSGNTRSTRTGRRPKCSKRP